MEKLSNLTLNLPTVNEKAPPHELSASVDEIIKVTGVEKKYTYGYWLRQVSSSGKSFSSVLDILKKAKELPSKYNVGGFITNSLKK